MKIARNIVKKFEQVAPRFGIPKKLISDQGKQYESNMLKEFCERHGIKKKI